MTAGGLHPNCHRPPTPIPTVLTDNNQRPSRNQILIKSLAVKISAPGCPELATLSRTLKRRMSDILAFFDHERSVNGPTEAINGILETLRGIALGFPQPRQLHHLQPPGHRRILTNHTSPPLTNPLHTKNGRAG
jgi:hypothetical protein